MRTTTALILSLATRRRRPPAQARALSLTEAERAARTASSTPVETAACYRQPAITGHDARRRAFCILIHPSPNPAQTCRSFVLLRTPNGTRQGPIRTRVLGSNVCVPAFDEIEP